LGSSSMSKMLRGSSGSASSKITGSTKP
jgi:hypothetical protein